MKDRATSAVKEVKSKLEEIRMVVSGLVKLKMLGLAKTVVTGAFINGALIGGTVALGAAAMAMNARKNGGCTGKEADRVPEA